MAGALRRDTKIKVEQLGSHHVLGTRRLIAESSLRTISACRDAYRRKRHERVLLAWRQRFQWRAFDDGSHNLIVWDALGHAKSPLFREVDAYAGDAVVEDP